MEPLHAAREHATLKLKAAKQLQGTAYCNSVAPPTRRLLLPGRTACHPIARYGCNSWYCQHSVDSTLVLQTLNSSLTKPQPYRISTVPHAAHQVNKSQLHALQFFASRKPIGSATLPPAAVHGALLHGCCIEHRPYYTPNSTPTCGTVCYDAESCSCGWCMAHVAHT